MVHLNSAWLKAYVRSSINSKRNSCHIPHTQENLWRPLMPAAARGDGWKTWFRDGDCRSAENKVTSRFQVKPVGEAGWRCEHSGPPLPELKALFCYLTDGGWDVSPPLGNAISTDLSELCQLKMPLSWVFAYLEQCLAGRAGCGSCYCSVILLVCVWHFHLS